MDIGIIGGADGPTAILIATPLLTWVFYAAAAALLALAIFLIVRRFKKDNTKKSSERELPPKI